MKSKSSVRRGVILVFPKEMTTEQCEKAVEAILRAIPGTEDMSGVRKFDEQYGDGPVWYIP